MNWRFWRREQPEPEFFHEHEYELGSIKYVEGETIILKNCGCGDFEYYRVPGIWTKEELTGKGEAFSDSKFLKDCGIKR